MAFDKKQLRTWERGKNELCYSLKIEKHNDEFTDTTVYETRIAFSYRISNDSTVPDEMISLLILNNVKAFVNGIDSLTIESALGLLP